MPEKVLRDREACTLSFPDRASDLISERMKSGLAAAKARGKRLGRQPGQRPKSGKLAPNVLTAVGEGRSYCWIARYFSISKNTVLDIVKPLRQAGKRAFSRRSASNVWPIARERDVRRRQIA